MGLILADIGYTYPLATAQAGAALQGVSLSVEPGELVLVLGATGSGKSTLLRIAAGLLGGYRGSASIDGVGLDARSARGRIGLVFQDAESQLFADCLIDDVAFGPTNLGLAREEARAVSERALERVGLPAEAFGARSPFGLSGGEARRAAIAGVIAMGPRYLLLDEPTAGLDASGRASVRAVIAAERERTGIVVVSHSAVEFLGSADRVILLSCGRAVFSGPAEELVRAPRFFDDAGLVAPDVLRVQQLAAERGAVLPHFTLDPEQAAHNLVAAGGWR